MMTFEKIQLVLFFGGVGGTFVCGLCWLLFCCLLIVLIMSFENQNLLSLTARYRKAYRTLVCFVFHNYLLLTVLEFLG